MTPDAAAIEFLEWTPDHRLHDPKFLALRADKPAHEVVPQPCGVRAPACVDRADDLAKLLSDRESGARGARSACDRYRQVGVRPATPSKWSHSCQNADLF